MEHKRECGTCSVCCYIGAVPELEKPAHMPCKYECNGCSIYGKPERPIICKKFRCAYLNELVDERPNECGVMLSVNHTPTGRFGFAIELEPNAFTTKGKETMAIFCDVIELPVIGVSHASKPPDDVGDYVFVHDDLKDRCHRIIDREVFRVGQVGMYIRKEP